MRRALLGVLAALTLSACAFSNAMERGDAAMARQDWDAAVQHYGRAAQLDPHDADARNKLARAQAEAVGWRLDGARDALRKGDLLTAAQATNEADNILPGNSEVAALSEQVLEATVGVGRERTEDKRYADARELFATVGPLVPDPKGRVARADQATVERWLAALKTGRDAATKANRTADALLYTRMIVSLAPSAVERAQCTQLTLQLRPKYELTFMQRPLDVPDSGRGGRERANPDQRFDKLARGIAGARPDQWLTVTTPDDTKAKPTLTLLFTQTHTDISDRHERETRREQVQTGVRRRPNPDYARGLEALAEAERRIERGQRDFDAAQAKIDKAQAAVTAEGPSPQHETAAERDLADAARARGDAAVRLDQARNDALARRNALDNIPRDFDEPIIETVVYDVMHHFVRAAGRLVTKVERGKKVGAANEVPLLFEARDDAHAEQPLLRLPADPIDLPSDRELRDRLDDQALQALRKVVDDLYTAAVADQKAKAMALGGDARVEQLVVYLMMDKATQDAEIDQLLREVRGIPDASTLLDDCGVPAK